MLANYSIKVQFTATFVFIIVATVLLTALTYLGGYLLFLKEQYDGIYPANHFERQIPAIEERIHRQGAALLQDNGEYLEEIIPTEGIIYQLMDTQGGYLGGTDRRSLIHSNQELIAKMNTTYSTTNGYYTRIIPLFDAGNTLKGAVALSYTLTPTFTKAELKPIFAFVLVSPIIYMVLFTLLFASRFAKNISNPVNMLIEASQKVQREDLDFEIPYRAQNELGRLCQAFDQMKESLKESLLAQWQMEQEKEEMIQAVAHDLKTPLTLIQGYAEALQEGNSPQDHVNDYLKVIQTNASKAARLVGEILYASRLGESSPTISSFDLAAFLQGKQAEYMVMAAKKNLHIKVEIANPDNLLCTVNPEALERVLDNLVANSISHTPPQGTVKIQASLTADKAYFRVLDTGPGFTRQDLANAFRKFYRGDKSRSAKDGHAGLGLYIAHQLIHGEKGTIYLANHPPGGALVEFTLPNKVEGGY